MSERVQNSQPRPLRTWPGQRGKPRRFVLLHHSPKNRAPHFDLLLELHPLRKLWDLETSEDPTLSRTTIKWETHGLHRRRYLRFEGDIGQGRGVVKRVESGRYIVRGKGNTLRIQLVGKTWKRAFEILQENRGRFVWVSAAN